MERWRIEHSREQVVAATGRDQRECTVACGFPTVGEVVSRRNRLPVDRVSLDRTGGACGGVSCGEYQG